MGPYPARLRAIMEFCFWIFYPEVREHSLKGNSGGIPESRAQRALNTVPLQPARIALRAISPIGRVIFGLHRPLSSLRIDREVVDWFKSHGARYQSRMNAVLKAYLAAHR